MPIYEVTYKKTGEVFTAHLSHSSGHWQTFKITEGSVTTNGMEQGAGCTVTLSKGMCHVSMVRKPKGEEV